jgi:hypothetical protein
MAVIQATFPTVSLLLLVAIFMEPTFFGSAAFLDIALVRRSCSNFKIEGVWLESESTSSKKKNKKKEVKKQTTGSNNRNGFGGISLSSSSSAQIKKTPFDASSALIRSAKLYEELSLKASKVLAAVENEESYEGDDIDEEVYSEFLIAAKYVPPTQEDCNYPPGSAGLSDWVPVAQLCLIRNRSTLSSTKMQLHNAVSTYCREIYHAAQTVAPIFNNIPRPHIRYSAEPLDSFFKYVYDNVLSDPSPQQTDEVMTKAQARDILGIPLESTNDLSLIKQRYRTLSMQFHPDSAVSTTTTVTINQDNDDNDISAKFRQVRLAYDTLCSGIRVTDATGTTTGSFYETLGGKDRTDFLHIPPLISPDQARKDMAETIQSAVIGLDSDTVMAFVTRNLAASVAGNTKHNYKN